MYPTDEFPHSFAVVRVCPSDGSTCFVCERALLLKETIAMRSVLNYQPSMAHSRMSRGQEKEVSGQLGKIEFSWLDLGWTLVAMNGGGEQSLYGI